MGNADASAGNGPGADWHHAQLAMRRFGTFEYCFVLFVTRITPNDDACAAIIVSIHRRSHRSDPRTADPGATGNTSTRPHSASSNASSA